MILAEYIQLIEDRVERHGNRFRDNTTLHFLKELVERRRQVRNLELEVMRLKNAKVNTTNRAREDS